MTGAAAMPASSRYRMQRWPFDGVQILQKSALQGLAWRE